MRSSMKFLSSALMLALAVSLVACSGNNRVRKPAELTEVKNQFELTPVWTAKVSSSDPFNFHLAVAGDGVYAASHNGDLTKLDVLSGKKVWSVDVPEKLSIERFTHLMTQASGSGMSISVAKCSPSQ